MSAELIWRGEAIRDVQEAFDWYELRSAGTGHRLLSELDEYVAFILENAGGPARWRTRYGKMTLKRFPYQLIYRFERNTVIIYSVFHTKRDPKRWGDRH